MTVRIGPGRFSTSHTSRPSSPHESFTSTSSVPATRSKVALPPASVNSDERPLFHARGSTTRAPSPPIAFSSFQRAYSASSASTLPRMGFLRFVPGSETPTQARLPATNVSARTARRDVLFALIALPSEKGRGPRGNRVAETGGRDVPALLA